MSDLKQLIDFLKQHKYNSTDETHTITHTAMKGIHTHAGSYYIPVEKLTDFHKLYKKLIKNDNSGYELNLIERHAQLSPIIIDLDFKYTLEHGLNRLHTPDIIKNIVNAYITEIKTIWSVNDEDLNAYVFERDTPYYAEYNKIDIVKIVKDGVHIIFPHIVSSPDAQYYLRNKILLKMPEILQTLPLTNSINDIVDESIILKNGWFLYGSCKPSLPAYKLTDIYNSKLEIIQNKINNDDLPEFLSIRNKTIETQLLETIKPDLLKLSETTKQKNKNNVNSCINIETDDYKNNVLYLLSNLNETCWNTYDMWLNIIWFMYKCGINEDNIHEYSQKYDTNNKYDADSVNKHLERYNKDKCELNIGTMFYYLKKYGCDSNIYNKCLSLFNNTTIIPLEDINADEMINLNNIGSYLPRLEKADIVCVRSNMMTYKTQNLKELVNHYKKIVIVSFRVSLDEAYINDFEEFDFKLYSDIKGNITDDRVVVQIDSMHKLRGKYDLLILDEIVYSIDHLASFVKEKKLVWDTLTEYIKESSKIIVCDALLNNTVIQLFKNIRRRSLLDNTQTRIFENINKNVYVVDNAWTSFSGYTADIINANEEIKDIKQLFIIDVLNLLKDGKKVVVPITSIKVSKELIGNVNKELPNIKICYISKDTTLIDPTEWNKYDLLVYTPTIAAGVSFNMEYYDNRICYFSNQSCSAELATQMIFRVRNSTCKNIKIYVSEKGNMTNETDNDKLDKWIQDVDKLDYHTGLNISRVYEKILKDDYYSIYKNHIRRRNMSKNNFSGVLCGILEAHGIKIKIINPEITDELNEKITDINISSIEINKTDSITDALNVVNSKIITDKEAAALNNSYKKTQEDNLSLRKYHILKTYGDRELTPEFVEKYEKITSKYYNICEFAKPDFEKELKQKIQNKEISTENIKRLHKSTRDLKLHWTNEMIKMIGYTDIFDTKHIKGFPYEKIKQYLIDNGEKVSLLFNTNKKDWNTTELDANGKKSITAYINARLKEVVNITIVNKHRGGGSRKFQEYIINGISAWEKDNIAFIQKELNIDINEKNKCLFDCTDNNNDEYNHI